VTHTILAVGPFLAVDLTTSSKCSVRYTKPKWLTPRVICSSARDGLRGHMAARLAEPDSHLRQTHFGTSMNYISLTVSAEANSARHHIGN